MGSLPCTTLGITEVYYDSTAVHWGYNAYWKDWEWYAFITNAATTFNSSVIWNSSLDWTFTSCSNEHADGIETATHESGHVQGLGHTGHKAIMYPVASYATTPFETLQGDDVSGIIGIYPGTQPICYADC